MDAVPLLPAPFRETAPRFALAEGLGIYARGCLRSTGSLTFCS
jgi:hypothetical protein